ncbi:MAG: hypothetical protein K8W52_36570 [Deltaproteobacteria bacterium]|nr:hypothetical protein [Deltaproteobacteria bacterium]
MRSPCATALFAISLFAGCGGGTEGPPPPSATPPAAPATNDPAFAVSGPRDWYLIGNALTPGNDQVLLDVVAPAGVEYVDAWVGPHAGIRLAPQPDGHLKELVDVSDLGAGTYDIVLGADGADTGFATLAFRRSHPLYAVLSTDYDFADPSDQALARMESIHRQHPELVITHFFSPYTFTDPTVTEERRQALVTWLLAQRDTHGDELGLHIHPYCNFVEAAGVTCITDQSVQYAAGDPSGYTIKCAAYSEAQFTMLLHKADELFMARGLGKPITFRAGAWTASIETLRALAADGFVADTSALNWAKVDEWKNVGNKELYRWNMEHWLPITDDSQPYYPNHDDPLAMTAPTLPILQAPDNGAMVDYVGVSEMVDILAHNWDGGPLAKPTVFSYGFHPSENFSASEQARVDGMAYKLDQALASADLGPVVYTVLRDLPKAFPAP